MDTFKVNKMENGIRIILSILAHFFFFFYHCNEVDHWGGISHLQIRISEQRE